LRINNKNIFYNIEKNKKRCYTLRWIDFEDNTLFVFKTHFDRRAIE